MFLKDKKFNFVDSVYVNVSKKNSIWQELESKHLDIRLIGRKMTFVSKYRNNGILYLSNALTYFRMKIYPFICTSLKSQLIYFPLLYKWE